MKKLVVIVALLIALVALNCSAYAEVPVGGIRAKVHCHRLSLRAEPAEEAKTLAKLDNGQEMLIVDNEEYGSHYVNGFSYVMVEKDNKVICGWVLRELITTWPFHLVTGERGVQIYASPSMMTKLTDELSAGVEYTILEEMDEFYIVNFREAAGFIRKDENVFVTEKNNYYRLLVESKQVTLFDSGATAYALPDEYSAVVAEYPVGATIEVVGRENANWLVVMTEAGRYAYVHNSFK